jgi:hypothetical protein
MTHQEASWPGGARLAVSVPMQLEGGGQPVSGASGPITEPILPGFPISGRTPSMSTERARACPASLTCSTPTASR